MKNKLRILIKGLLSISMTMMLYGIISGQPLSPTVVATGGGYSEASDFNLSWTVGELSINTLTNPPLIMTQGFQQSFLLAPLPVELMYFYGEVLLEGNLLKWITITETNNDYFTLLRSTDGRSFSEVTTVKAVGTSTELNIYNYLDTGAPADWSYYRLDQRGFDGSTVSSDIISLERLGAFADSEFKIFVFPNPASDELTVNIGSTIEEDTYIQIFDQWGRMLQTHPLATGQQKIVLDINDLRSGVYFLSLRREKDHQVISTTRIVKSRL